MPSPVEGICSLGGLGGSVLAPPAARGMMETSASPTPTYAEPQFPLEHHGVAIPWRFRGSGEQLGSRCSHLPPTGPGPILTHRHLSEFSSRSLFCRPGGARKGQRVRPSCATTPAVESRAPPVPGGQAGHPPHPTPCPGPFTDSSRSFRVAWDRWSGPASPSPGFSGSGVYLEVAWDPKAGSDQPPSQVLGGIFFLGTASIEIKRALEGKPSRPLPCHLTVVQLALVSLNRPCLWISGKVTQALWALGVCEHSWQGLRRVWPGQWCVGCAGAQPCPWWGVGQVCRPGQCWAWVSWREAEPFSSMPGTLLMGSGPVISHS